LNFSGLQSIKTYLPTLTFKFAFKTVLIMKLTILILALFFSMGAFAQTLPNFDQIKLEKAPDYKVAEPYALQTANFILSTPLKKTDKDILNSLRFMGKWMNGTPDYSFAIGDMEDKIGKDNDVLGLYMIAKAKYILENKANAKDAKLVKLNATILLLNYCSNKDNLVRMTKQLKKLAEAKEKGQLEQAL
jgi:hypothetical protein